MMDALKEMEILRCQVHEQLIDIFSIPVNERVGQLEDNCLNFQDPKTLLSNSGTLQITGLPPKIFQLILKNFSFKDIAQLRLVCKYFDSNCSFLLNSEFYNLQVIIQQKLQDIKAEMPKRVSARKSHPRAHECEVIETLSLRMSLLNMAFDKPIEKRQCCFFPGEIIDEIHDILKYLKYTPNLKRAFDVTKELYEISNMAFEHLRKCIKSLQTPKVSLSTTDQMKPSFMTPGSSSSVNKPQSFDSENEYTQDILVKPTNKDRYKKVKRLIEQTTDLATRNRMDILEMRSSLSDAKTQVYAAVMEIHDFLKLKTNCQRYRPVLCDSLQENTISQITDSALDNSAVESPSEVYTFCENEANSTKNLPAETKKIQSLFINHVNDNLTTEPPMKKKKK